MLKNFQDMPIWQESMKVAVTLFEMGKAFPKKEDYGLTSQIRRSALSISANIVEAYGRYHIKDKINFYYYARGSATETQSHLIYCKKVKYLDSKDADKLINELEEICKSLNKIIKTLHNQ